MYGLCMSGGMKLLFNLLGKRKHSMQIVHNNVHKQPCEPFLDLSNRSTSLAQVTHEILHSKMLILSLRHY